MRGTVATISLKALTHNFNQVLIRAPRSAIIAMVKANAYGHGLIEIAKALRQAQGFGVATVDEALLLRHSGIKQPIWLMQGLTGCRDIPMLQKYQIIPVISSLWEIAQLKKASDKSDRLTVWLELDLGMHRLGISPAEQSEAIRQLVRIPQVHFKGVMGHFSHADIDEQMTLAQFQHFQRQTANLSCDKSLANSAAIICLPQTTQGWVRPGIMMYGAHSMQSPPADIDLQPVMTLKAPVIALHRLGSGQSVGYGGTWTATVDDTKIAVVAIGYGDGYPRSASNQAEVLIRGQRAPVVGVVSMDMIMINVTHLSAVMVGDMVTLWGEGLPVEEVAAACGTIANHCLAGLTQRVPRIVQAIAKSREATTSLESAT